MHQKLLATLDGSATSEAVLPCLTELVRILGPEEVVLLNVIEVGSDREVHLAESYLKEVTGQLEKSWKEILPFVPHLRWSTTEGTLPDTSMRARGGDAVAGGVLRFAKDHQSDLIIMATHGRTGFNRWLLGSVAESVVHDAEVPVFLMRASQEAPSHAFHFQRILVPLDGSPLGEQCLPYVEELVKKASPEVNLLYVEPSDGEVSSGESREDMITYLEHIANGLAASGSTVVTRVRQGQPGDEILQEVQDSSADMVVMTTHGRSGLGRLTLGSVAYNIVSHSVVPVYLVRVQGDTAIMEHLQSPLVYRCYHCGHRTFLQAFTSNDQCGRCHYHLKACGNCIEFDGLACVLQRPEAADPYPGNRCPGFEFRKVRVVG